MRVLILSQYFWPENFRINELASELTARGHEVCVLTGQPNYPDGRIFDPYRRAPRAYDRFGAVEVVRVPILPRGRGSVRLALNYLSFATSALLLGAWKLRGRGFDRILVFQPSPATIGLPSAALRAIKRAPTVFWVQDLWPDTLEAVGGLRSKRLLNLIERFVAWVYGNSDHVLAQSRAFLPRLREQAPPYVPVSYLPNWPDTLHDREASPASEQSGERDGFDIYYLGNLGEAQDLPAVLDAIGLLRQRPDIRWHFVGGGRMSPWLRDEIARRGLGERVRMPGAFPLEEMPRFHALADALLVSLKPDPVFALTIPSKVQSYLAAGRPILGMLDGEGARIIDEAGAGLTCAAGDGRALAAAAVRLADLPAGERAELGRNGARYGHEHFGFAALVGRLEAILRDPGAGSPALDPAFGKCS